MLEGLFGSKVIEKILFFLIVNDRCFATQLSRQFHSALSPFQKGLERLEGNGIIVSVLEGKTRIFCFNPRYPFLKEIKAFIGKAYEFLPKEMKEKYYEPIVRKRPRRTGKPL